MMCHVPDCHLSILDLKDEDYRTESLVEIAGQEVMTKKEKINAVKKAMRELYPTVCAILHDPVQPLGGAIVIPAAPQAGYTNAHKLALMTFFGKFGFNMTEAHQPA